MAYSSNFTKLVLEKDKKKKSTTYSSDFTKSVLEGKNKSSNSTSSFNNTSPISTIKSFFYNPEYQQADPTEAIHTSLQGYHSTNDAFNSLSNYSDVEINKALNTANKTKDLYKSKVMEKNDEYGILYDKNKQNINPNLGLYQKESLKSSAKNPTTKYENAPKKSNGIIDTASKAKSNYEEGIKNFKENIENTEEYKKYDDYAYRAVPILKQSKNQREVANEDINFHDKVWAPIKGGTVGTLNTLLNYDGERYKLANGETVNLPTKSELKGQKTMDSYNSFLGKLYGSATYSLGNMAPSIAASAINPALGTITMGANTYKKAYNDSLSEGYTKEQASNYATANTTLELGLGKLLGGMTSLYGKSQLSNVVSKSLSKVMSSKTTRDFLAEMGSEFTEEYLQEIIDPWVKNITLGEDNEVKLYSEEALISGLSGLINAGISNYPKYKYKKNREKIYTKDYVTNLINSNSQNNIENSIVNSAVNNEVYKSDINIPKVNKINANSDIVSYNQHEINNFKNGKVKIAQNETDVAKFINASVKVPSNAKLYFGKIGANIANKIKSTLDINLENYNISLKTDAVRHIINHHSNKSEVLRGQIPITNEDFKLIPQIISEYDRVKQSGFTDKGKPSITFEKQIGDNYYLVNYVSDKSQTLEVQTMYKAKVNKKNSATGSDANILRLTSETDSGTSSFSNDNDTTIINKNQVAPLPNSMQNTTKNIQDVKIPTEKEIKNSKLAQEIESKTIASNSNKQDVQMIDINDVLPLKNNGGYRTNEQITNLEKQIKTEGIKNPIELIKRSDGSITIDDGNHRLEIAQKLGLSKVPVKFVRDYVANENDIVYNKKQENLNFIEGEYDGSFRSTKRTEKNNDSAQPIFRSGNRNSILPTEGRPVRGNDSVYPPLVRDNNRPSSNSTRQENTAPRMGRTAKTEGLDNSSFNNDKILNPIEISNLSKEDANTTPNLPNITRNQINDGESKFYHNIKDKTNMLNEQQKHTIMDNEEVQYYDKVTNKESLEKAFKKLNDNGKHATETWFGKNSKEADATDVAQGWILLKQYADNNDADGMVAVAKKMRDIGTKAGQTVQAFNIMERMTPEGMVKYAQSELSEAYDNMVKNKSKAWIDKHRSEFDLKPEEVQFIMDNMREISKMEDGYDKRVKLAEIQKLMTDKLPAEKGTKIKSWMRISMLFNPKTQVRNIAGNAVIAPVNYFGDIFSSYADKLIAKKTGIRTTGNINIKAILKGFKEGALQATNDYKKGINTKDMEGNRFEIGQGKSYSDKNIIGRNLNRVESLLNYVMDAGDRMFSQSSFENSLQNQMILNNTTEVTQDMIDIARTESLQRTWNDNNNYTKFVLDIRRGLNKVGVKGYGLGDILIPFAKTPANITKAIVDYSPLGMVKTMLEGNNLRKSLNNGQFTSSMQHKFVQDLGKATAGTMLYIAGYALAQAGIVSGESDEDKDTASFLRNTLGINSYSIKIGNKSFSYDWAQPIAAPLSIMANFSQKQANNKDASALENLISSLDVAGNILLEQSFLESINTVLNNNDGIATGIEEAILELPARAIPTFVKQIADLADGTQRTTFEYDKPLETVVNKIKVKLPGISKSLTPSVDTMGREIQKYGGKNNIFNVFLNPANVTNENVSKAANEIYRLYKETGSKDIMPRVAPYYLNKDGEKISFTSKERAEYQKVSGKIIEDNVNKLTKTKEYKNKNDEEKSEIIKEIVNYSYNIAKKEVLGEELSQTYQKAYDYSKIGNIGDYYSFKNSIDVNDKKGSISKYLINSNLSDKQIAFLYGNYYSSEDTLNNILTMNIPMKEFIKLDTEEFESNYNIKTGKSISGTKQAKVINYVNSLNLTKAQKAILIKSKYKTYNKYNQDIFNYVNNLNKSAIDKKMLLKSIGFDNYNSDIVNYINSQKISKADKEKKLKSLGFTVRNGRVYN